MHDEAAPRNPHVGALDRFADVRALALLGEAGSGKSTAMRELEVGAAVRSINLRSWGSEDGLRAELRKVLEPARSADQPLTLLLDSLDEGLLRIETLAGLLVDELTALCWPGLRIRVACRTGVWPSRLERGLRQVFGDDEADSDRDFTCLELLPLRRVDILTFAEAFLADGPRGVHLSAEGFLAELDRRGCGAFAARPMSLQLLLNLYKKDDGRLPSSRWDLYERATLHLADEHDPDRPRRPAHLNKVEARHAAACLAATAVLANRSAVWSGADWGDRPDYCLSLDELADAPAKPLRGLSHDQRTSLLATALFEAGESVQVRRWAHATIQEFLAVWYLDHVGLGDDQIYALLAGEAGAIPPQLAALAVWGACRWPAFREKLLCDAPDWLLDADPTALSEADRAAIVQNLLTGMQSGQLVDRWHFESNRFACLYHTGLADQLRSWIVDSTRDFVPRRVAIEIAEGCALDHPELMRALAADLVAVSLDPNTMQTVRSHAVATLRSRGTVPERRALLPLAQGQAGPDDGHELRGLALSALWPGVVSAAELFELLNCRPSEGYFGSYGLFLRPEMVNHIDDRDLSLALDWVRRSARLFYHEGRSEGLGDLLRSILSRAWVRIEDPAVLAGLVEVLPALTAAHVRPPLEEAGSDMMRRRMLVTALLATPTLDVKLAWLTGWELGTMHVEDDLPWLLDWHRNEADPAVREKVRDWVRQTYRLGDVRTSEWLLAACLEDAELGRAFSWFWQSVDIDSPQADEARRLEQLTNGKRQGTPMPGLDVRGRVLPLIERAGRNPEWWPDLLRELTLHAQSTHYGNPWSLPVEELPGWAVLDGAERSRVLELARRFLVECPPREEEWVCHEPNLTRPLAACVAFDLLTRQTRWGRALAGRIDFGNPPVIATEDLGLTDETWGRWSAALLRCGPHLPDSDLARVLIQVADGLAPASTVAGLLRLLDAAKDDTSFEIELRNAALLNSHDVNRALFELWSQPELSDKRSAALLDVLISRGHPSALDAARRQASGEPPGDASLTVQAEAAVSMLRHVPTRAWSCWGDRFVQDDEFADAVIGIAAWRHDDAVGDGGVDLSPLSPEHLGILYERILEMYPPAEDPSWRSGRARALGLRDQIAQFRDRLIAELARRPDPGALSVVDGLTERHPEIPGLRWKRDELRDLVRRHCWQPLAPADVLRRISRSAARGELAEPTNLPGLLAYLFGDHDEMHRAAALRQFARSGPDGARVANELSSPASLASIAFELSEIWRQLGCRSEAYRSLIDHFRDERALIERVQALDP